MKKLMMTLMAVILAIAANAQRYNVGSSRSNTDYFGTRTTTHSGHNGLTTGKSSAFSKDRTSSVMLDCDDRRVAWF